MSCGASKRSVLLELASPFVVEIWCRPAETVGGHCLLLLDTMESTCLRCFCVQPSWFDSQEPGSQAQVYRGSRPSSADGRREERKIVLSFLSVLSDPESPQTSERFSEESSCLFTSRGAILGALETRRQIQDTPEGLELPFSPGMSWNVLDCPGGAGLGGRMLLLLQLHFFSAIVSSVVLRRNRVQEGWTGFRPLLWFRRAF